MDHPLERAPLSNFDSEELISHLRWLTRLARRLTRDDDSARDLAQETMSVLVQHRPNASGELRALLAGMLRRIAMNRRREEARRKRRERHAARPESIPSSDDLQRRIDLQRVLAEELGRLSPAYRDVIALRYLEDQPVAAIARRMETSPGTVRARLSRGLAKLRERLDRHFGTRKEWSVIVLAGNVLPKPGLSVPTGFFAMSTASKSTLSVIAIALALIGWFVLELKGPPAVMPDGALWSSEAGAMLDSSEGSSPVTGARDPGRKQVLNAEQPEVVSAWPLSIRVVNEATGDPLARFQLELQLDGQRLKVWTDSDGLFTTDEAFVAQPVTVRLIDHPELPRREPEVFTIQHSGSQSTEKGSDPEHQLEARTGPTLRFETQLPPDTEAADYWMELYCRRPGRGGVYVAEAPLRSGDSPWARFGPWAWALPDDVQWEVRGSHRDGLHFADTAIEPLAADRVQAVPLDWTAFGRLIVELDDLAGDVLFQHADMDLYGTSVLEDGSSKWVTSGDTLREDRRGLEAPDKLTIVFDFLAPGVYRGELEMPRYQPAQGTFTVETGRTTRAVLTLHRRPGLAPISGVMRVKSGGQAPGEIHFVLPDDTHPYFAFAAELERQPSGPAGRLSLRVSRGTGQGLLSETHIHGEATRVRAGDDECASRRHGAGVRLRRLVCEGFHDALRGPQCDHGQDDPTRTNRMEIPR